MDALHDPERVDRGRAYVTDESYAFSEREHDTITFYDEPNLFFARPDQVVAPYPRLELLARFHTFLWVEARRIGPVQSICGWIGETGSLVLPRFHRRYLDVRFFTGSPGEGPSDVEVRSLIRDWQRADLHRAGR